MSRALGLLLAVLHLAAATAVCPPEPAPSREQRERLAAFASGAPHATHASRSEGPSRALRAPCPCPCKHAPPGASASRLEPALLAVLSLPVAPGRSAGLPPAPPLRARARAAAPDPVPRAA